MHLRCPHCLNPIEVADLPSGGEVTCLGCGSSFELANFSTASWAGATNKRMGKFEVLGTLGHGAFGTVVKAHDTELDRIVAIKIPRAGNIGPDPQDLDRFLREARSVAQLRYPSIITIHEVGTANGTPYLVCDFVEGVTLADHLTGRRLSLHESAKLLAEVADALQYAHSLGVVHRDVKPSNIMIRPDGTPCVMDFGLAKRDAGEITMTIDGQILGTPAYMSPEQARGEGHKVDGRSDVYSSGVILYQLLTGELPFRGSKAMLLHQVLHDEPKSPRSLIDKIPRDLETIALKAMAKEPGRRYASAKEMADDLRRWLAGEPILARPVGTVEHLWRWCRRKPALASMTVALAAVILVAFTVVLWQLNATTAALARAEHEKRQRALTQVNALREAAPGGVPGILADIEGNRATVLPQLRASFAEESDRAKRMRLALALLPVEPDQVRDELIAWMLQAKDPAETLLVGDALRPHSANLATSLWQKADDPTRSRAERFNTMLVLASFDTASPRWKEIGPEVAEGVLTANALHLSRLVQALRPVRLPLLSTFGEVFRGVRLAEHRQLAAAVLAEYAADQPQVLADLLMDADEKQFGVIYPKLKEHGDWGLPVLITEIDKKLSSSDENREKLAKRQANAAVALLKMDRPEKVWPLLKHSPDPRGRSDLIHRFGPLGVDAKAIVRRLVQESDVTIRRALTLSLGAYGEKELSHEDRKALLPKLQELYRSEAGPGIHAASEWLLRSWQEEAWLKQANNEWATDKKQNEKASRAALASGAKPQWYVNGQGQTMVVIPGPVEVQMGSPLTEAGRTDSENQHKKRINRVFALGAKSVTVEQYRRFETGYKLPERYARSGDLPVVGINWYMAAAYCNWLSKEEGIDETQWCYEIKGQGIKLRKNYLSLTGYRLPTEAEFEYAMRAETLTSRYHGETDELLPMYAWYTKNSQDQTWPVGTLKPNDLGLFDMHGNAFTWCQESYKSYGKANQTEAIDDQEDRSLEVSGTTSRVLRGGSFGDPPPFVRSANRNSSVPMTRSFTIGFRVARTVTPGSPAVPRTP